MGITIGLDLGVASVGWAVVNDEYQILESCSNIFPAAEASKNVERRGFRQGRRLTRRRKNRVEDFEKLWAKNGFTIPNQINNEVLALKIKALSEKITEEELYQVLVFSLKHRGISYLDDAESGDVSSDYSASINYNEQQLKDKLPCEIQWERLQKYGAYRGNITITENGENLTLRNVFTTSAYRKEISQVLSVQQKYNSKISDSFISDFLSIFNRKREYYIGPGNELSRTDYGVYTTKKDETGKFITDENLFDKLIGKCSVYPDERRAAGASYTAQEFNILNDLNNLTINGERKLTEEEKKEIIKTVKSSKTVNMKKIIGKVIGESNYNLSGVRIDKNEKEVFHSFEAYNKMRRALEEVDFNIEDIEREDLDIIGEILTLNTDKESILKAFESKGISLNEDAKECLIKVRKSNGSLFSKWQSLGLTIMKELIPELYSQPKNQMQLLTDMGVFKTKVDRFSEYDSIPADEITEEIYNPVVSKTVRITVRILNALIKKYGYPDRIVVEMPRDKNSDDEQKRIKKEQKDNENEIKDILDKVKKEYGREITGNDFKNHSKLTLKLKLWNEQNGTCPYSGRPIRIDDLLDNPNLFEVDHIIPLSISFDDSRSNKVLVYSQENQDKGNRTPFSYLSGVNRKWDFHEFMDFVLKTYTGVTKRRKKDNLLYMEDITKIEVLKGFVQRNINDTRYASKVVLNTLQDFFKAKDCDTKVSVIRGSYTHQMRVNLKLEKDRDESYVHHAVDAMLIAFSQMGYDSYRKISEKYIDYDNNEYIDEKGFIKFIDKDLVYKEELYSTKWLNIKASISKAEKNNKYWYQVNKKCNRALCNQTVYGTREYDKKIYKISKLDIRTDDGLKKFKGIIDKGQDERFLMFKNDPKTFDLILDIYKNYYDAKNPFIQYEIETGEKIRKYSKKNNGPVISLLKYTDGEVNSCIDISHKYGFEKGSKKVILDSLNPYRMDVYYNNNDKQYYLVGVKQSDIKCQGDKFVIDEENYAQTLINEKMIKEGQTRTDLEALGYEFRLSFYKNDIIEYEKDGKKCVERFLSRTMPQVRNYIETKPIDAPKFDKQHLMGLGKTNIIKKIGVDILGNRYYIEKMKFNKIVGIQ
ncbi:MAG TPA: type II CRISPR RNA-guided endonuclease Cas9 [Lachnospiraceae bacterium]|nr:type II CRISPR RNA-guided endonuclease Cas9 [Lachnospiraceae bacterium]